MDEDEFDDELFGPLVESKPLSKFTLVHFGLSMAVGVTRTFLECLCDLGNQVTGHEYYVQSRKEFEDAIRADLECLDAMDDDE